MENKYINGKIYKISSSQCDKIYIGSTYLPLQKRLTKHLDCYKCYLNGKAHYVSSFDIVKYDDHKIELLELFPCNSKTEIEYREGIIQRQNKDIIVNYRIAGRSKKQYTADTKDKKRLYDIEYRNQLTKIQCTCGTSTAKRHLKKHLTTAKHLMYTSTKNII